MKRWWSDFKQFLPSLLDGMRDYPLTMPVVALGIAICLGVVTGPQLDIP